MISDQHIALQIVVDRLCDEWMRAHDLIDLTEEVADDERVSA